MYQVLSVYLNNWSDFSAMFLLSGDSDFLLLPIFHRSSKLADIVYTDCEMKHVIWFYLTWWITWKCKCHAPALLKYVVITFALDIKEETF